MASLQRKLAMIDVPAKYTVYGWLRNMEKLFDIINLPLSEIAAICILYFFDPEMFKNIAKCIKSSEDKKLITKITHREAWHNSSYGSIEIDSESDIICQWDLKISNENGADGGIVVGIASKEASDAYIWKSLAASDDYMYLFGNWGGRHDGRLVHNQDYGTFKSTERRYINNGKISICLNLKLRQLSFSVDDVDQGIAFKNIKKGENINYRLMVSMSHQNSSVEIIQFWQK